MNIKGKPIDDFTRCVHYHSEVDTIAIKFKCCQEFYPCYECHEETAGHRAEVWPKNMWNEMAVLCGRCKQVMTIRQYLNCNNTCMNCGGGFNPRCSHHYHLYFEMN